VRYHAPENRKTLLSQLLNAMTLVNAIIKTGKSAFEALEKELLK
jgi:hypothetical protein